MATDIRVTGMVTDTLTAGMVDMVTISTTSDTEVWVDMDLVDSITTRPSATSVYFERQENVFKKFKIRILNQSPGKSIEKCSICTPHLLFTCINCECDNTKKLFTVRKTSKSYRKTILSEGNILAVCEYPKCEIVSLLCCCWPHFI